MKTRDFDITKKYEPVDCNCIEKINWKRDTVYATLTAIVLGAVLYAAVTSSLNGGW